MAEQSEIDKDIRGSNEVDPEKIAAYQEGLRAMAAQSEISDSPRPADAARAALQAAQERVQSGQVKPPEPSSPIAEHYQQAGREGVEKAREQRQSGPDPNNEESDPPTLPDPRQQ
ncbi:MAG: hypothetical protein QG658_318 [Patescibacteria group bacterium]|nr:hypothetical protein [Patescibacteria group bacterium]